jgi:flavocytochrome c
MQKEAEEYEQKGSLKILYSTKAVELIEEKSSDGSVSTVEGVKAFKKKQDGEENQHDEEIELVIPAKNVILATGGFAAARHKDSYLAQYAPELLDMPATFGDFSTGDGIRIASAAGAGKVDMDKVQIHPTGFVDPVDPSNPSKILCAEVMRGVGGILLNEEGRRFCNELGTRDYVTSKMMEQKQNTSGSPCFHFLLSGRAGGNAGAHIGFYSWKGLFKKIVGVEDVANYCGFEPKTLRQTLTDYQNKSKVGKDEFGKTTFPDTFSDDLDTEEFYVGSVVPVLHYTMGGLTINTCGEVLNEEKKPIPGLYACGEVAGGVHGSNRLAGNSLLECLVYGRIVGNSISL